MAAVLATKMGKKRRACRLDKTSDKIALSVVFVFI
jgi:hypothetical protein